MHTQIKDLDFTGQNIYAGIDTHKKSWKVSIYTDAIYHKTFNQPPKPEILFRYLTKHFPNGTFYSVYEAGFCGFWIHERLQSLGINNIVVNPADVPTTDKEKKQKTDRVDSNKLARQLRNKDLEAIYIHKRDILEDRSLIRMRRILIELIVWGGFNDELKEAPKEFLEQATQSREALIQEIKENLLRDHISNQAKVG